MENKKQIITDWLENKDGKNIFNSNAILGIEIEMSKQSRREAIDLILKLYLQYGDEDAFNFLNKVYDLVHNRISE